jgi:hypothetical protein
MIYKVIQAISYIFEVEAESSQDAKQKVINDKLEPVEIVGTDDIYVEELT